MSHSREQMRKKHEAQADAMHHQKHGAVDGFKHEVSMAKHEERFNPYSEHEGEERKEHGQNIHDYKFNEASYRR